MGSDFNKTVRDFAKALQEANNSKTTPYDISATVKRIDGNVAWVHIPGGIDETPVQLTTNAKKGDSVQVRVNGGRAWITGNATSPPTDDTTAKVAQKTAVVADEHAVNAVTSAMLAQQAADDAQIVASQANTLLNHMEEAAEAADTTLIGIYQDAKDASTLATSASISAGIADGEARAASRSALLALRNLSMVEDVVNTVDWIQKHGYYELSTDDTVDENKIYYAITGTQIVSPTGNPHSKGYYEKNVLNPIGATGATGATGSTGAEEDPVYIYVLTSDTTVQSGKTYYSVSAVTVSTPTGNPSENLYYELRFDTALSQYVSSHLSLTDSGLSIVNDQLSGSLLMSSEGVTIKNAQGITVGQYGEGATIGATDSQHISIVNGQINFWAGTESIQDNLVAYVSNQELHIPRVVVVQSLQMGYWRWDATMENHLSLNWIGE